MTETNFTFDWSNIVFGSKKPINALNATFIAAPRELSPARFTQLIKTYLPSGNIVLGLAKENFVAGFEDQPQFRMLKVETVQNIINKVNRSSSKHKIYTLHYQQRELNYLFEKLDFKKVLLVNGSWHYAFHNLPSYYTLVNRHVAHQLISPFIDEAEAQAYDRRITKETLAAVPELEERLYSELEMMTLAAEAGRLSFDYNFQTGVALGRKASKGYRFIARTFNRVIPFQTYALHHGASRETHFSPPHDLNHYDTVHAEVELIIMAQKQQLNLKGTTLFINLLPCPACSRMFCETDIAEFVYREDHSDGYGVKMLELAGKKVRRVV